MIVRELTPMIGFASPIAQQELPASARGMVILFILGAVVLIFLGFVVLTMARWLVRRRMARLLGDAPKQPKMRQAVRELSPWETAGRRATPENLEGDEHGTHRDEGLQ